MAQPDKPHINWAYKPQLDSLRALAVVVVIIYHARFFIGDTLLFSAGFMGVDLFFLISGYIISLKLMHEYQQTKQINFLDFYDKRIRRLFPTLIIGVIFGFFFSYLFLNPEPFKDMASSIKPVLLFYSNFYFDRELDYFAGPSDLNPFLHAWSLSVEEQFYVLFPVFLFILLTFSKKKVMPILTTLFFVCFIISANEAQSDQRAAFFLIQFRVWEFLLGIIIATLEFKQSKLLDRIKCRIIEAISLTGLLGCLLYFDKTVPHPAFPVLVFLCFSALFLVSCQNHSSFTNTYLTGRNIRFIGLISYTLYIVHQIVFVLYRHIEAESGMQTIDKYTALFITLVVSMLVYFCIEQPVRNRQLIGRKFFYSLCILFLSLILVVAHKAKQGDILPLSHHYIQSIPAPGERGSKGEHCPSKKKKDDFCLIGDTTREPLIALVGDSHAMTLINALDTALNEREQSALVLTQAGCIYAPSIRRHPEPITAKCEGTLNNWHAYLLEKNFETIIIFSRYTASLERSLFNNTIGGIEYSTLNINRDKMPPYVAITDKTNPPIPLSRDAFVDYLRHDLNELAQLSKNFILIYPVPEVGWHPYELALTKARFGEDTAIKTPYSVFVERNKYTYAALDSVSGENIIRVKPADFICDSRYCNTRDEKGWFYYDDDHLSHYGAEHLINSFINTIPQNQ